MGIAQNIKLQRTKKRLDNIALLVGELADVKVKFANIPTACTDGKTIQIRVGDFADDHYVNMAIGLAFHEGGHVKHTDFPAAKNLNPKWFKIYNGLEDVRMEGLVQKDFKGAKKYLHYVNKDLFCSTSDVREYTSPFSLVHDYILYRGFSQFTGNIFMQPKMLKMREQLFTLLGDQGAIEAESIIDEVEHCKSTQDSVNLTLKLRDFLQQFEPETQESQPPQYTSDDTDSDADSSDDADDDSSAGGSDSDADSSDDADDDSSAGGSDSDADSSDDADDDSSAGGSDSDADSSDDADDDSSAGGSDSDADSSDDADDDSSAGGSDSDADSSDDAGDDSSAGGSDSDADSSDDAGDDSSAGGSDLEADSSDAADSAQPTITQFENNPFNDDQVDDSECMEDLHEVVRQIVNQLADEFQVENPQEILENLEYAENMVGNIDYPRRGFDNFHELETVKAHTNRLKLIFKRALIDQARVRRNYVRDGGVLDGNRILDLVTNPDRACIFRNEKRAKASSAAVSIIVDASSSMGDTEKGIKPYKVANQAAFAMANALDQLTNVECEVRHMVSNCSYLTKRFGQRADMNCFAVRPSGFTPTAELVRGAIASLNGHRFAKKLVIVVTDGKPDDVGVLRLAVSDAQIAGVGVKGIGINCPTYGIDDGVIIKDVSELHSELSIAVRNGIFK